MPHIIRQVVTETQPAHVWTVDYGRFNAKGWPLMVPLGEPIPASYPHGRVHDHAVITRLLGEGLNMSAIAARAGCSVWTVYRIRNSRLGSQEQPT